MIDNVYDLITTNMERLYADNVAFCFYDEQTDTVSAVRFGDYAQDIRRAVTYFKTTIPDIRGRKVCLLSRNCYEYAVNSFGVMMAGGVLVPMNQRKTWDELLRGIDRPYHPNTNGAATWSLDVIYSLEVLPL